MKEVFEKMEEQIIKNANKIMWVQYWLGHYEKPSERRDNSKRKRFPKGEDEIIAKPTSDNKWVCEIDIPLVNKTVKAVATTEINAMLNASNKAAKLIDEYLENHPELNVFNRFKNGHWQIIGDENGNYIRMGMSPEASKRNKMQLDKMVMDSFKAVENAIARLEKILGYNKDLFIQVLDKNLFQSKKDMLNLTKSIAKTLMEGYGVTVYAVNCLETADRIIAIGYTSKDE